MKKIRKINNSKIKTWMMIMTRVRGRAEESRRRSGQAAMWFKVVSVTKLNRVIGKMIDRIASRSIKETKATKEEPTKLTKKLEEKLQIVTNLSMSNKNKISNNN